MPSRWAIRALREIAAVLVYVGWLVFWLVSKIVALFLGLALWMLLAYTRLRYGRPVADELLRAARESEAEGRALRERNPTTGIRPTHSSGDIPELTVILGAWWWRPVSDADSVGGG